jgi:FAD:protein FMN transferase
MRISYIATAGILFILAACVSRKEQEVRLWGEAQGSTYSIIYIDKELRTFHDEIDSIFQMIDESMSTYLPESLISKFNSGQDIVTDEHFLNVLKRSIEVSRETGGVFDATVAPLVNAWGFGPDGETITPESALIDSLRNITGYEKLTIDQEGNIGRLPGMKLDFNAIAQGYTVDIIAMFLEKMEVSDYMVEVGGEIRTLGKNAAGKPWKIGIDKPIEQTEGRPLQVILNLSGQSLATSGSYRKFRMEDGKRYSHAIDPLIGRPVEHNLLSVTVLAADCTLADAYATAFLIMGIDKTLQFIKGKDIHTYFISDDGNGGLDVIYSDGFKKYIAKDAFE